MGDGKSRLLDEMKSICFGVQEEIVYCLFCNFENDTMVQELPSQTNLQDVQKQVHKEILDRLMFFLMDGVTNGPCPVGGSGF